MLPLLLMAQPTGGMDMALIQKWTDAKIIKYHAEAVHNGRESVVYGDYEGKAGNWFYAESPLIDGDKLICTPGGNSASTNSGSTGTWWKSFERYLIACLSLLPWRRSAP